MDSLKKHAKTRRRRKPLAREKGSATMWAHYSWLTPEQRRQGGVAGHVPHLALTRAELVARYGRPKRTSAIVRVRVTILPS